MKENTTTYQQEIYLEPNGRIVKNAEEIAEVSQTAPKNVFCITYEVTEKTALLSEMKALNVEILAQSDLNSSITVRVSMAQLAAVKSLYYIEKVEAVEEDEAINKVEDSVLQNIDKDDMMGTQAVASEPMTSYSSCCPNTIGTAVTLPLEIWRTGCICCPCAEMWYQFTASVTGYHTIHTDGILDTIGYLYDENGCQLNSNDDSGLNLNFKIVYYLTANRTYYVMVKAYSNNTGTFRIAVENKVYVESVTVDAETRVMHVGAQDQFTATVLPANASNKLLHWTSSDTEVASVNAETGVVTAKAVGTVNICATAQDGTEKQGVCVLTVDPPIIEDTPTYLVDQLTGVQTFSYAEDGEKALSKNFKVKEFRCKDGSDEILIDMELVRYLQQIRDWAGASITINSGYRTPSHNASVGGSSRSQHIYGKAADIVCSGKSPLQLAQRAETLGMMGIEWNDDLNYTHVDTRTNKWHVKRCEGAFISVSSFYDETE